jgi:hypothetical protein
MPNERFIPKTELPPTSQAAAEPSHCLVCGSIAPIRWKGRDGRENWYCPRHVPPPENLSDAQREWWQSYQSVMWFVRDNKRMPSTNDPDERKLLLKAIVAAPGTGEFRREYRNLERAGRRMVNAKRRWARFSMAWNLGCLFVLAAIVIGIVLLVRKLILGEL